MKDLAVRRFGVGQYDLRPKQAPEPLVNLDAIVLLSILGQIIGMRGIGINQAAPGVILPATGA